MSTSTDGFLDRLGKAFRSSSASSSATTTKSSPVAKPLSEPQRIWNRLDALFTLISLSYKQGQPIYDAWVEEWAELVEQTDGIYKSSFTDDHRTTLEGWSEIVAMSLEDDEWAITSQEEPPSLLQELELLRALRGDVHAVDDKQEEEEEQPSSSPKAKTKITKEKSSSKDKGPKPPTAEEIAASILGCDRAKKILKLFLGNEKNSLLEKDEDLRKAMTVLFYGPSGTGKTELSRYAEALVGPNRFKKFEPGDVSALVGETESKLKAFFEECIQESQRDSKAYVLWFDEMDFMNRSGGGGDGQRSASAASGPKIFETWQIGVNALLSQSRCKVFVLGATNYPYRLSPAVLDRFKIKEYIPLPTTDALLQLVRQKVVAAPDKFAMGNGDIVQLTEYLEGRSYRNVLGAINSAKIDFVLQEQGADAAKITVQNIIDNLQKQPRQEEVVQAIEEWRTSMQ